MSKESIYFAHSKRDYGTWREHMIINHLRAKGLDVLCPHNDVGELGGIQPYLDIVKTKNRMAVLEHQSYIGRGVYEEVKTALANHKPVTVYRLIGKHITEHPVDNVKLNDPDDWCVKYGRLILKG